MTLYLTYLNYDFISKMTLYLTSHNCAFSSDIYDFISHHCDFISPNDFTSQNATLYFTMTFIILSIDFISHNNYGFLSDI